MALSVPAEVNNTPRIYVFRGLRSSPAPGSYSAARNRASGFAQEQFAQSLVMLLTAGDWIFAMIDGGFKLRPVFRRQDARCGGKHVADLPHHVIALEIDVIDRRLDEGVTRHSRVLDQLLDQKRELAADLMHIAVIFEQLIDLRRHGRLTLLQ